MEYGLLGEKLSHSFSPEIHSKIGKYEYSLKEVERKDLESFIKNREYRGLNVTIPYKSAVIPFLDEIDESAKKIGAVNTIVNENGFLKGFNTDFFGLTELIKRNGFDFSGRTVLILGTGGTSKTAKAVSESLGAAKILKVSRSPVNDGEITYNEAYEKHKNADFIINTTPVGMYPDVFKTPADIGQFENLSGVIDAIYNPLSSKLLLNAKENGIKTAGGLYMLTSQAIKTAVYFTKDETLLNRCEEIYASLKKAKENIVLIGMPGCGKTTVGNILSSLLNRKVFDTDEEISRKEKKEIPEIFKTYGEGYFRAKEAETVKELSLKSGVIISTGGGVVLNEENIGNLKLNGKVFFLDRPLNMIIPTSSRPLSSNRADLEKRYKERYSLYKKYADETIGCISDLKEAAEKIFKEFV